MVPLCDLLTPGPNGLVADRDALGSAVTPARRPVPKGPRHVFPTTTGTTWEQITLTVEDHHLRVQVGTTVETFGFTEAGFEDRREKGTPDELWVLLGVLARFRGELGTGDPISTKSGALKSKVSALRDRLRTLLALEGDPFHPSRRGRPYRTRFTIRRAGLATFPTPPGATWDDLTITETVAGGIEVGVTTEVRGADFVSGADGDGARWAATTGTGDRLLGYTLADLGLTGPDGTPTPAGAALVAVLRAGGRFECRPNDPAVLALGAALTRFFPLDGPPFTFDPKRHVWVATFEAASLRSASDR